MKVVNKQLLFIRSQDRNSGEINDFRITIPMNNIKVKANQYLRVTLGDIVLPRLWYNTRTNFNNQFAIGIDLGAGVTWYLINIPDGCYTVDSLLIKLVGDNTGTNGILNSGFNQTDPVTGVNYWTPQPAAQQAQFFMEYDEDNGKYKFYCTQSPAGAITTIRFDVDGLASGLTIRSAWQLLGLSQLSSLGSATLGEYVFPAAAPNTGDLYSNLIVTVQTEEAIYLRTDLQNWNVMRGGIGINPVTGAPIQRDGWEKANIIAHIPITVYPYSNIVYQNMNDDYSLLLPNPYIESIKLQMTDEFSNLLPVQQNYELTLKFETLEHTEMELKALSQQQLEMLKTLVIQREI